eukprot:scpid33001/ scgid32890/ 
MCPFQAVLPGDVGEDAEKPTERPDCEKMLSPYSGNDEEVTDSEPTASPAGDQADELESDEEPKKVISKRAACMRKKNRSHFGREGKKRRLANDRERKRVRTMSEQFQNLSTCLPIPEDEVSTLPRKTILEEAIWYIQELLWMKDTMEEDPDTATSPENLITLEERPPPPSVQRHVANLKQREEVHNARKARRRERRRARAALARQQATSLTNVVSTAAAEIKVTKPGPLCFHQEFSSLVSSPHLHTPMYTPTSLLLTASTDAAPVVCTMGIPAGNLLQAGQASQCATIHGSPPPASIGQVTPAATTSNSPLSVVGASLSHGSHTLSSTITPCSEGAAANMFDELMGFGNIPTAPPTIPPCSYEAAISSAFSAPVSQSETLQYPLLPMPELGDMLLGDFEALLTRSNSFGEPNPMLTPGIDNVDLDAAFLADLPPL